MRKGLAIASLLIFLILGGNPLLAQKEHEVQKEETLFSISQKYGVEVERIKKANDLEGANIEPGQTLMIPTGQGGNGTDTIEHKVKEEETLYSICQEYNADIDQVLRLNPDAKDQIEIGQVLRIPVGTDPPDEKSGGRFPFDTTRAGYHYHKVKKGQTLFSLSQRYGIEIDSIRTSNSHLEKEPEVGQVLRIPKSKGKKTTKEDAKKDPLALPDSLSKRGFRVYRARPKETLYSIARRNGISLDRLMKNNPHIEGELQKGQALRIPIKESGRTPRSHMDTIVLHTVEEGESVRSIATMYGTDPSLIILANGLFYRDIQKGELLLVPIPPRSKGEPIAPSVRKERYRITLLLPLYLTENDSILQNPPAEEAPELYGASSYALEFYEGFRIAADSVAENQGISFDIRTIATRKKQEKLVELLKEKEVRKSDLVVGPFYSSNLKPTAEHLKGSGAHLVCPVRHSNKILLKYPNISKAVPSSITLIKELADHLVAEHGHRNVILLDSGNPKDNKREQVFRDRFDRGLPSNDSAYRDSIRVLALNEKRIQRLKKVLKRDTLNVLVAPNKKKVFASRLMNDLSKLNERLGPNANYPVKIYASEDWKNFSTVDIKYKERFNLHIITGRYIQHDSLYSERFYKSYRERNHTDPGDYGFLGHDVGSFYLHALVQHGTGFSTRFDLVEAPLLHMGFDFFRTGVSSGFENRNAFLIRYTDDHHIERISTR